jgi:mono/diheme cytochrome c family protein
MRSIGTLAPLVVLLGMSPVAAAAQSNGTAPPDRSAREGVYTAAQADRGAGVFTGICQSCHTTSQFSGADFELNWKGRTVRDLVRLIRTTMPYENPGSLSRREYIDVVAYLLKLNEYPAGGEELDTDEEALRRIRLDSRDGN